MEQPPEEQFNTENQTPQEEVVLPGSLTERQRAELRELIQVIRRKE